ncbi:hypothetical protein ABB37_08069 [Leptomonas pyrrhocoris]|uniref:Uncharacterized protein n=1 Tax=Leptomonas pyrrhocoris TaxID=157538 RepID=A0A0M9FTX6_LEPPY|nr:hypothetical protein ABB37_08069 [Leptomonas pyrrhocoris]KPA75887.1 hypothetical protein ABB37_08069 [Leptomonas pyrrhocoris]|eukprot:XP_015654326.1 hypothetical protein ABB37_08069 [Leptomonas pyrrhocoris]
MGDFELQMRALQYSAEAGPASHVNEDAFSTNVDAVHGADSGVAALAGRPTFFPGLTAEDDDDDEENPNDVLLRLLNEVRAVDSDVEADSGRGGVIDRSSDENAAGVLFSVTDSSGGAKGFAAMYGGAIRSSATATATAAGGGFTVEGNASYSSAASLPPPPPPPPPAYGTPSTAPRSPFVNCYSGIPHLATTPASIKPPPPSFAEAMAKSHGTPVSLPGRPSPSQERSPAMATYVPPMPAAPQETVLLRNGNGIFLLQPLSKLTPPYTPPAGCNSPPVSPLPRYSLPPAAGMAGPNSSITSNTFLGTSVAQVGTGRTGAAAAGPVSEPPHYASYSVAGGSSFIASAPPFVSAVSSLRGTPSFAAAPPPYTGGL